MSKNRLIVSKDLLDSTSQLKKKIGCHNQSICIVFKLKWHITWIFISEYSGGPRQQVRFHHTVQTFLSGSVSVSG